MKKVGLLFGSFNPVHIGHLFMAEMAVESGHVDEVWFIVSPESPYKTGTGVLAPSNHRFEMVSQACKYNNNFIANDIEFSLSPPSYTYLTLAKLKKLYPEFSFYFICGTDVYVDVINWHGGKEVIEACSFLVYPRSNSVNYAPKEMSEKTIFLNGVPNLDLSSTFLRKQIKNNKTTEHLLPKIVQEYIIDNNLYKK